MQTEQRNSLRLLQWMMAASLALPIALFGFASAVSWVSIRDTVDGEFGGGGELSTVSHRVVHVRRHVDTGLRCTALHLIGEVDRCTPHVVRQAGSADETATHRSGVDARARTTSEFLPAKAAIQVGIATDAAILVFAKARRPLPVHPHDGLRVGRPRRHAV